MLVPLILTAGLLTAPGTAVREYVALGDSWSADVTITGIVTDHAPSGCAQSSWNYPKQVARALRVPVFRDATCGAATTAHMTREQEVNHLPPFAAGVNRPQFDRLRATTDLVTLGIGGNDAGLATAAAGCVNLLPSLQIVPGLAPPAPLGASCKATWVTPEGDRMSAGIRAAEPAVARVVDGIRKRSPRARILVVNYLAGLPRSGGCYPYVQANDIDLEWLGDKLEELNHMLARVARAKRVTLVDTYTTSIGHDVCQLPKVRWVEGVLPFTTDPPGLAVPLHPNRLGADHQARRVLEVLQEGQL